VQTTPLPTALADHTAVAHNGFLYAIGGHTGGSTCVKTVWYAPINADGTIGQWATTASLPENTGYTSVVIHNNHMLIAGGQNTTSPHTRRTSVYHAAIRANGTLGSWQATTPLPETMSTLGTVITINDWVYVLGGINRAVYAAQMKGDASISTWHAATSLPAEMKLEWATGRAAVNGWIYTIAGGQNGQSAVYMSRANGASLGDWQSTTAIPRALGGEAVVVYNNIIYVIGGDWRQASAFYGKVR
jgi:N-acetylneuraminic acid mutarotase